MTPEGKLKAACRKEAKAAGLPFWNIEGKGVNGIPDTMCGCYPLGTGIVEVEFKRLGETPVVGGQQWKRIHEIRAAGGLATWCDNIEDWRVIVGLAPGGRHTLLYRTEDEL